MTWRAILDRFFIKQPRLRRAITAVLFRDEDVVVELAGVKLLINSLRENGYLRASRMAARSSLFRDELPVLCNLGHFARNGGAFVDAGANVGLYSAFFSRFSTLYPTFEVHAFEAAPSTFQRLKANSQRCGFRAFNVALGAEHGRARFVEGAVSHVATLKSMQNAYSIPGEEFEVEVAPLSAYAVNSTDIILKIDVEGQESEVLKGAARLFEERRVCAVYCDGWSSSSDVPGTLKRFGFRLFDGRSLKPTPDPGWALLALRPDLARSGVSSALEQ